MQLSELFSVVIDWARSTGAKDIHLLPGVWYAKTIQAGALGPLDVRINGHCETREGIPPFNIKIGRDDYFPGVIAIVGPDGGIMLSSQQAGEDEAGLIEHFKQQVRH